MFIVSIVPYNSKKQKVQLIIVIFMAVVFTNEEGVKTNFRIGFFKITLQPSKFYLGVRLKFSFLVTGIVETVIIDDRISKTPLLQTVKLLQEKYHVKRENIDESLFQALDPKLFCAEVLVLKNLEQHTDFKGLNSSEDQFNKYVLDVLSEDIENLKNEIDDTQRCIDEENSAINRMQEVINRLTNLQLNRSIPDQNIFVAIKEVNEKFKEFKHYFHELVDDVLYPGKSENIKQILMDLVAANTDKTGSYPYIPVKEEYDSACIALLTNTKIIKIHPESVDLIKLSFE